MITRTGEDFQSRSALQSNTISGITRRFATPVNALAMLLALPDPWNLRLPLYLTALVWSAIRPRITLYLMPFAVAWGSLDYLSLGGLRLDSADILVGFLLAGWLLSYVLPTYLRESQGRIQERIPSYLTLTILALLGIMFLSMVTAISKSDSLKEISKWLEFLALVFIGSQYLQTRRQIWTMVILICIAGLTQAAYGYAQAAFSIGPQSFIRDASLRVFGTFDQPNPYAGFINMPLSISLALALLGRAWATRVLAGIATVLLAIALYL